MPKKKSTVRSVAKKTITAEENQKDKEVQVPPRDFVFFFFGGAGDVEPYYVVDPTHLVEQAKDVLVHKLGSLGFSLSMLNERTHVLGYADAKGEKDIENKILSKINNIDTLIYLIGHSLGGWNAAHLSSVLTKIGYQVEFLVTLDPVGDGVVVSLISDIYWSKPEPKYVGKNWINVRAEVNWENYQPDDFIADLGGQWDVVDGPMINSTCECNHGGARRMFTYELLENKSAMTYVVDNLLTHVKAPAKAPLPNVELN